MKHRLDSDDIHAAVIGGCILGGGGGGLVEAGLDRARAALAAGRPWLWSVDDSPSMRSRRRSPWSARPPRPIRW
ncbi:hypothetical protein ACFSTI_11775 [Rhizorhabdus histidinilytica]